ncbi:hypothetical protein COHA_008735 [Chlorella ohadii]|uniref:Pyrroloquinoline quinone-dependent pyranose dehydrogenase beta-propeller domain-containing protein n=1 Tax=Chlorella ohadii TaxID=2649997 RepID=A0AAD5H1A6_9CHLO|nr:hypothetical protein COHA_008735 [Chlorella ohadii]
MPSSCRFAEVCGSMWVGDLRLRPPTRKKPCALLVLLALLCARAAAFTRSDWTLPAGFNIELYFPRVFVARSMALSGNSQANGPVIVYVGSNGGTLNVTALVDLKGRGQADYAQPVVVGVPSPNGVAWRKGSLYIGSMDAGRSCRIYRLDNADWFALNRRSATLSDLKIVRGDLPTALAHGAKVVRFGPDGKLYFGVGAPCNACKPGTFQASPTSAVYQYGTLYRMNPDGTGLEPMASGVRNTVGFDFHPDTGVPYFTDNGRDQWNTSNLAQTDNTPDCELNAVTAPGHFMGFPFCHTVPVNNNPYTQPYLRRPGASAAADPDLNAGESVMKCTGPNLQFRVALQAMGPHTAPLGMRFYRWFSGANFPKFFNNSILIAQRGSWNRNNPIGARVMRVVLDPADPLKVRYYVPFLCGGVPGDTCAPGGPVPPSSRGNPYKGRPVDVEQLPDGSLLVSDNEAHTVYRISYAQPTACRVVGTSVPHAALTPRAIVAAPSGCAINLGSSYVPRYRRCIRADVSQGAGRQLQLATSLAVLNNKLVLSGALLLPNHACALGPAGWVGFGLPKDQGSPNKMAGAKVLFIQPAPSAPSGATVYVRLLNGTSPDQFKPTTGLLARGWTLKAYVSGGSLVTTFEFVLPSEYQKAAIRAGKIPRSPGQDISGTNPAGVTFLLAFGDVNSQRQLQRHWMTGSLTIPFSVADISASLPSNLPVLNRGVAPDVAAPTAPPPPPFRPPPFLSREALMATTSGWIAWSYNKGSPGKMTGGDALFVRPCASCPTRVSTVAFYMGDKSIGAFTTPTQKVAYTVTALGTAAGGVVWAQRRPRLSNPMSHPSTRKLPFSTHD